MGTFVSYIIGDNILVTSLIPLRIQFAGRSKQNVNLVNEHMDFRTIQNIYEKLNEKYFRPKKLKSNSFKTERKSIIIGEYNKILLNPPLLLI